MNTDHSIKNTRFGLRATHEQALLDKRLFVVNKSTGQQFLDLLNRAETDNQGLKKLFSQPAPWESQ